MAFPIGAVQWANNGIIGPRYCFATVDYNQSGDVFTYDLHSSQFND